MLRFKDFVPNLVQAGGFFQSEKYEPTEHCLSRMNHWIEDNNINVLNIETVMLPNIFAQSPARTDAPAFTQHYAGSSSSHNRYHPTFRVWYNT